MAETAKLVSKGEQRFCPVTNRVISTIYGMTSTGEIGVIDTCVTTVEDFTYWLEMQKRTMEVIQRHQAQAYIESLPKGRRRKAPSNVVAMRKG
jgi:hypothetical protein